MARVSNSLVAVRRERVADWWVKGASISRIAREVGADWETVKRDLAVIGRQALAETDVPAQLVRLLRASQGVEAAAWDAEQLGLVLAAQRAQVAVLQTLQGIDLAQRVAELEQRLDAAQGVNPWQSVHTRAEHRAGRN